MRNRDCFLVFPKPGLSKKKNELCGVLSCRDLQHNKLTDIHPEAFVVLKSLEDLYVQKTFLSC